MRVYVSKYQLNANQMKKTRIVHLSDIHFDLKYNRKRFELLIREITKLKPNYICITGDIIDNNGVLNDEVSYQRLTIFLKELTSICKTIVTLGNHERKGASCTVESYQEVLKKIRKIPHLIVLENETYQSGNLYFVGFNPRYEYYKTKEKDYKLFNCDFQKLNLNFKDNQYNILLVHTPNDLFKKDIYETCHLHKFHLILAGHTHGGMMPIKIKGHRGIISPAKRLFPENARGYLKKENTNLIICSGIIRLSNTAHFFKYFNNLYASHINCIDFI